MATPVRLNKHLAHTLGISRREADTRIEQGRVFINGKIASLGNIIDPEKDVISLDDKAVAAKQKRYTFLVINKPVGYVCSRKQQGDAPTIYALLPREYHHLKVAGRLDKDSCGLVLLTDDGDAIYKLTHPKFGKEKVYHVGLNKPLVPDDLIKVASGVQLEDGRSAFTANKLKDTKKPNFYKVVMHEGRNRQIRRTFKALGYSVTHLQRISFGSYKLSDLKEGQYQHVSPLQK